MFPLFREKQLRVSKTDERYPFVGSGIPITQRTPSRTNKRESSLRHIRLKLNKIKDKEKNGNAARGIRHITYKGATETVN